MAGQNHGDFTGVNRDSGDAEGWPEIRERLWLFSQFRFVWSFATWLGYGSLPARA